MELSGAYNTFFKISTNTLRTELVGEETSSLKPHRKHYPAVRTKVLKENPCVREAEKLDGGVLTFNFSLNPL